MAIRYSLYKPPTNGARYKRMLCQVWRETDEGRKCIAYGLEEDVAKEIVNGANSLIGAPKMDPDLAAAGRSISFMVDKLNRIDLGNQEEQFDIDAAIACGLTAIQKIQNDRG